MVQPAGLLATALRSLLREAPMEKKILIAREILKEISSLTYSTYIVASISRFTIEFTPLFMEIISRLDPSLKYSLDEDGYIFEDDHSRAHPYLYKILKRIGPLSVPDSDVVINVEEKILNYSAKLDGTYYSHKSKKITYDINIDYEDNRFLDIFEKNWKRIQSLKLDGEVDQIIDEVLREKGIKIDSEEVRKWVEANLIVVE